MVGSQRRVVITGLGLVTPLGDSPDRFWGSLVERQGAVRPIEAFPVAGLSNNLGAEIRHFDFLKTPALAKAKFIKELRKSRKYMARDIQLCVAAAQLACVDAGLDQGGVNPTRVGIDLGAGLISTELDELAPAIGHATPHPGAFDFQAWGRESIGMIEPIWLLKYLPNMLACHISILMDCQGPSNTITEGDASSNLAIARGRPDHRPWQGRRDDRRGSRLQDPSPELCPHGSAPHHVALAGRSRGGLPAVRSAARR